MDEKFKLHSSRVVFLGTAIIIGGILGIIYTILAGVIYIFFA